MNKSQKVAALRAALEHLKAAQGVMLAAGFSPTDVTITKHGIRNDWFALAYSDINLIVANTENALTNFNKKLTVKSHPTKG